MRILFDYQIFNGQKVGGISRYYQAMYDEISGMKNHEATIGVRYTDNEYLKPYPEFVSKKSFYKSQKAYTWLNRRLSLKHLKSNKFDVFHPTNYKLYHKRTNKLPWVVTVYDLTHERFPEQFKTFKTITTTKKNACLAADKIIAISHSTKNDLVSLMGIPEEKIDVTYLAGGFSNKNLMKLDFLPEKYILFVGGRGGYKNFKIFFDAVAELLRKDPELHLVCTGSRFKENELNWLNASKVEDRVIHHFADEDEFYTIYNLALAFVFPSKYEGFGIPALEAMSSDCPAILSRSSSLTEVGGDAAEYFDPESEEDIRNTISKVIYNKDLRQKMIEAGRLQNDKFNWEKTTNETIAVYNKII